MVLLAHGEPFLAQGRHHAIEHVDNLIGLALVYMSQTAAEILSLEQVGSIGYAAYGFHNRPVKYYQQYDSERREAYTDIVNRRSDTGRQLQCNIQ